MASAGGKKPWRCYYALALPNSAALSQEKVNAVVERTAEIACREEEFLLHVLEKSRRQDADPETPSVAAVVTTAAQRLCVLLLLLECAALVTLAVATSIPSDVQRDLIYAGAAIAGVSAIVNVVGWLAIYARSLLGVRVFLLLSVAVAAASALVQSELKLVRGSQEELRTALHGRGSRYNLTEVERDQVLDGGDVPSLTQRFVFDGPAWFLSRLEQSCSANSSSSTDPEASAGIETYALRWDFQNTTCVNDLIGVNMDAEAAAQVVVALFLVALTAQIVLASMLLLVADSEAFKRRETQQNTRAGRRARRQRRKGSRVTGKAMSAHSQALHRVRDASIQPLAFAIAIMASTIAIVSWQLLDSCSFDTSIVDHWLLGLALGSGLLTLVGLLLVRFTSIVWWSCCALSCGIAFNIYVLSELAGLSGAALSRSDVEGVFLSQNDSTSLPQLKTWYDEASKQHCSIVAHWMSHVCLPAMATTTEEAGSTLATNGQTMEWNATCQHEFATLLANTVAVLSRFLAILLVLDLALLALVAFPLLHRFMSWLWGGCCVQWRPCWSRCTRPSVSSPRSSQTDQPLVDGKLLQQSSLEYSEALRLYLSSIRSANEAVREAECAAFEEEWARKTRRPISALQSSTPAATSSWLPGFRTVVASSNSGTVDGVMIAQRDFEAIVRTLLIRRLVTRCKMDVSVSLSSDGQLLFAQLSASDNVLMARLCDLDEYELEFADAIDPGRSFWQQQGEMERDRKVLEPHEVKQQFKLLLQEISSENSGSTRPGSLFTIQGVQSQDVEWFRGESLVTVSARIHALRRISRLAHGEVPPSLTTDWYHAAARVRYSPRPQLQFLYKKYPNKLDVATGVLRRASVLRTVDCLRITRLILDEEFNVDAMLENGLLTSFQCLHSASRMDFNSRTALASSWIAFWRRSSHESTSKRPSQQKKATQADLQHRRLWWRYWCCCQWLIDLTKEISSALARWSPHRQPIQNVRDYFGEHIAFFVAWSGLYVQLMTLPAFVVATVATYAVFVDDSLAHDGTLALLWGFYRTSPPPRGGNVHASNTPTNLGDQAGAFDVAVGVVMTLLALVFAKMWERQSAWYQLKWGSTNSSTRSCSTGDIDSDEYDLLSLPGSRLGRRCVSWCCVTLLISCNAAVVLALVLAQGYAVSTGWIHDVRVAVVMSCSCQAVLIQWLGGSNGSDGGVGSSGSIILRLAIRLSKWEDHQHDDAFQSAVILKLFVLQLANSLTGLLLLLMLGIRVDEAAQSSQPSLLLLRLLLRLPYVGLLGDNRGFSWYTLASDYEREIAPHADTFIQIQTLLALLLLTRIAVRVLTLVGHVSVIATMLDQHSQSESGDGIDRQQKTRTATLATSTSVETEYELQVYSGVAGVYADVVAELALVSMFSSALPVAPLLAFVDAALALRVNAVELSCLTRRPEPESSTGIGLWSDCVRFVIKLAAATTIALVGFCPSWSTPLSEPVLVERASKFLVSVAWCWLVIELLWLAVPDESGRLKQMRRRHAFLIQRYVFGDESGDSEDKQGSGHSDRDSKSHLAKSTRAIEEDVSELLTEPGENQGHADAETILENVQERVELLQRLNVAMRRHGDPMRRVSRSSSAVSAAEEQPEQPMSAPISQSEKAIEAPTVVPLEQQGPSATSAGGGDAPLGPNAAATDDDCREPRASSLSSSSASEQHLSRRSDSSVSSSTEHMIVGYYRPVVRPQGNIGAATVQPPHQLDTSPVSPPVVAPSTPAMVMGRPRAEPSVPSVERQPSLASSPPPPMPMTPPPMKRLSKLFMRATPAQLRGSPSPAAIEPTAASSSLPEKEQPGSQSAASNSESEARESVDDDHPLLAVGGAQASQQSVPLSAVDTSRGFRAVHLGGMDAIAEAARRQQFAFDGEPDWQRSGGSGLAASEMERRRLQQRRARGSIASGFGGVSDVSAPVRPPPGVRHSATQLSGLEAVREASSRQHFDFSSDDEAGWM